MPNCYRLTKKGESSPATLNSVDEAICTFLGKPVDRVRWCNNWHNVIGFAIATGKPLGSIELKNTIARNYDPVMCQILEFLEENYTSEAWYQDEKIRPI